MKPMLAATIEDITTDVDYPCLVSMKLDGVRATCQNGVMMSRSLKPLPNRELQRIFSFRGFEYMDGEIILGNPNAQMVFNRTTSAVMSHEGALPNLMYYVFDYFKEPDEPYILRLHRLVLTVDQLPHAWHRYIKVLTQHEIKNAADLLELEGQALEAGFEGLMVRKATGKYKAGRSTVNEQLLLKLKRFTDTEVLVVGYTELYRNRNDPTISETGNQVRSSHQANMEPADTLGALVCKWEDKEFNVGTGFTQAHRDDLWSMKEHLAGQWVRIKYQPHGVLDVPRLPVFLGFRDKMDT